MLFESPRIRLFFQQLVQAKSKLRITGPLWKSTGDSHVDSLNKGPHIRRAFSCYYVILAHDSWIIPLEFREIFLDAIGYFE